MRITLLNTPTFAIDTPSDITQDGRCLSKRVHKIIVPYDFVSKISRWHNQGDLQWGAEAWI